MKLVAGATGFFVLPGSASAIDFTTRNQRLATNWTFQGLPCLIHQQGVILLLINENGAVGTARWTGPDTFTVFNGNGWDAGLVGQLNARAKSINWSNNTVWKSANQVYHPRDLEGGWLYNGQACAVFQRENLVILVNEIGSLGTGIFTGRDTLTILGGSGWDLGLTARFDIDSSTLYWSNNTQWIRA